MRGIVRNPAYPPACSPAYTPVGKCSFIAPNDGAIGHDGASVQYENVTAGALADSDTINLMLWFKPVLNDNCYLFESSFSHTSGKTTQLKYPFQLHQRNTEQIRLNSTSAKGSLQVNFPTVVDAGEFNLFATAGSIAADSFTWMSFSETAGLASGTVVPTSNTGWPFALSDITKITVGAGHALPPSYIAHTDGDIAQALAGTALPNYTDPAIQARVLTAALYKSFQNIETGFIAHSGDTANFATNNGTLYASLTNLIGTLTDEIGPAPPFTL